VRNLWDAAFIARKKAHRWTEWPRGQSEYNK
jgi:hypothetical protein